jgi:hypothetical protein
VIGVKIILCLLELAVKNIPLRFEHLQKRAGWWPHYASIPAVYLVDSNNW